MRGIFSLAGQKHTQRSLAMVKGNKLDFTGQHIYVGMDIHKNSWNVSIYSEHFEHKMFTQPSEVNKLAYYLQRNFPGAPIIPYMKPVSVVSGYMTG